MAAIPVKDANVATIQLWIELTNRLVTLGAFLTGDTITAALAKAATEQAAH